MQHQTSGMGQWLAVFEVAINDIHDDLAVFFIGIWVDLT